MKNKKNKTQTFKNETNEFTICSADEKMSLNTKMLNLEHFAHEEQSELYKKVFYEKIDINDQIKAINDANDRIIKKFIELNINVQIVWTYVPTVEFFSYSWRDAISEQLEFMAKQLAKKGETHTMTVVPIYCNGIIPKKLH